MNGELLQIRYDHIKEYKDSDLIKAIKSVKTFSRAAHPLKPLYKISEDDFSKFRERLKTNKIVMSVDNGLIKFNDERGGHVSHAVVKEYLNA